MHSIQLSLEKKLIVVEKNGEQNDANLITKTIVCKIEECELVVHL